MSFTDKKVVVTGAGKDNIVLVYYVCSMFKRCRSLDKTSAVYCF